MVPPPRSVVEQAGERVSDDAVSEELLASGVKLSPQRVRQVIEHVKVRGPRRAARRRRRLTGLYPLLTA